MALKRDLDDLRKDRDEWRNRALDNEDEVKRLKEEIEQRATDRAEERESEGEMVTDNWNDEREPEPGLTQSEYASSGGGRSPVVNLPTLHYNDEKPLQERIQTEDNGMTHWFDGRNVPFGRIHNTFEGCFYQPKIGPTWPPLLDTVSGPRVPPREEMTLPYGEEVINNGIPPMIFRELRVTNCMVIQHLVTIANTQFHPQEIEANIILQRLRWRPNWKPNTRRHPLEVYVAKKYNKVAPWLQKSWKSRQEKWYGEKSDADTRLRKVELKVMGMPEIELSQVMEWMVVLPQANDPELPGIPNELIDNDAKEVALKGMLCMADRMPIGYIREGLAMTLNILSHGNGTDLIETRDPPVERRRLRPTTLTSRRAMEESIRSMEIDREEKEWIGQWVSMNKPKNIQEEEMEMLDYE